MKTIYNFSAGPAVLHPSVIRSTADAANNFNNSGMSLMEMSHRSKPVVDMVNETEELSRELLQIPKEFEVLFLQGGASLQFSMIPMNLLTKDAVADYTDTGSWSYKALNQAKLFGKVNIASSSRTSNYSFIPKEINQLTESIYLHITSNNTIYGTQWKEFPKPLNSSGFLVADMSSDIFSRPLNFDNFGLIYAGAQKNIGPAGVTLVVIRKELLKVIDRKIPDMLSYRIHIEKNSMFNTPPVMSIYAINCSLKWLKSVGGVESINKNNPIKAKLLYSEIKRNSLFQSPIAKEDRSLMNIPFIFNDEIKEDEATFLEFCDKRGLKTLKGHRSVGGFRASIYNAMPLKGVEALIHAMQDYEKLIRHH